MRKLISVIAILASSSVPAVEVIKHQYKVTGSVTIINQQGEVYTVGAKLPVDLVTADANAVNEGTLGAVIRTKEYLPEFYAEAGYDIGGKMRCRLPEENTTRWNFNDLENQGPICSWRKNGSQFFFYLNTIIAEESDVDTDGTVTKEYTLRGTMYEAWHGQTEVTLTGIEHRSGLYSFTNPHMLIMSEQVTVERPQARCDFGNGLEVLGNLKGDTLSVPSTIECEYGSPTNSKRLNLNYDVEQDAYQTTAYNQYHGDTIFQLRGIKPKRTTYGFAETSLLISSQRGNFELPNAQCDFGAGYITLSELKGAVVRANQAVPCKFGANHKQFVVLK